LRCWRRLAANCLRTGSTCATVALRRRKFHRQSSEHGAGVLDRSTLRQALLGSPFRVSGCALMSATSTSK
jgi:hypothetical protein